METSSVKHVLNAQGLNIAIDSCTYTAAYTLPVPCLDTGDRNVHGLDQLHCWILYFGAVLGYDTSQSP